MQYGLDLLLWTDRLHDGLAPVVDRIRAAAVDALAFMKAQVGRRRPATP